MTQNILIQTLSTLSRREFTRFCEFVHSPYFNKHKEVIRLVDYLDGVFPDFSPKKCQREDLFRLLYPTLPHDQAKLALVFTYAQRLAEQFFMIEQAYNEKLFETKTWFYKRLRLRKSFTLLSKVLGGNPGGVRLPVGKSPADGPSATAASLVQAAGEMDAIATALGQRLPPYLEEKQRWLETYFLHETLRDACELVLRSRILKTDFEEGASLKFCLGAALDEHRSGDVAPKALVYARLYSLLKKSEIVFFDPVLELIQRKEPHFSLEETQNIYNQLQNFCIEQINRGEHGFLDKVFQLYKTQLDKGLLIVDGFLPEWHYKNIVTTGLRLDESGWVGAFIEKYKPLLEPSVAENAYSYNLAAWYYHIGKHAQVLRLLVQVEYTDLRYHLDAKSLLLRTYFDLGEEEAFYALVEAFKQFLSRNKALSDFQKSGYFNLLKLARRTFRLKQEKDFLPKQKWHSSYERLMAEVDQTPTIFNKSWLEGKLEELAEPGTGQ